MIQRQHRVPVLIVLAIVVAFGWWRSRPAHQASPSAAPTPAAPAPTTPAEPAARTGERRRDLSRDEVRGGHTLARHVGRADDDLRERLRREPSISAASTYTDRATAERIVARVIVDNQANIEKWAAGPGSRTNRSYDFRGTRGDIIGRSLTRGAREAVPCTDATVVLRWADGDYYVLTSYPEVRR